MGLVLITAPNAEPLATAEAKAHANVSGSADDSLIDSLIVAARLHVEDVTRRRLVTQTWDYVLDAFPDDVIEMPYPPLVSVSSISYVDTAGATQVLSSALYAVDNKSEPGRIAPAYEQVWPETRSQMNAVTIRFVCGYGAAAAVPKNIKHAILLLIGHWYENREAINIGNIVTTVPFAVEALLMPHRILRF